MAMAIADLSAPSKVRSRRPCLKLSSSLDIFTSFSLLDVTHIMLSPLIPSMLCTDRRPWSSLPEHSTMRIKSTRQPQPLGVRKYVKIYSKNAITMLLSSSSPQSSKRSDRLSRSTTPSFSSPPSEDVAELSDVPCYTCRRRHVKCDRILPHCAKCAKKGVPCLGYQKPLRWADGVAVRGKLKGKAQPVVDSKVANIVRTTLQLPSNSAMKEAESLGIHAAISGGAPCLQNEAAFMKLITYHNDRICAECITADQSNFISREIAPLTPESARRLPTDILTCILANAAVHMASRNPGNRPLEQLALETKVSVYQNFNRQLQNPQTQLPDVLVACCALIFSMDLIEYGMSRWMVHLLGSINVVSSFGGPENLFTYYPHLQLNLTHMVYFETMWIILCHIPVAKPKQASRKTVELLCHAATAKQKFFNPCPVPLTLAIWDIGNCAQRILVNRTPISLADMHKREQILRNVLSFQPTDATKDIKNTYGKDIAFTNTTLNTWTLMGNAWKSATTLLVLRYLYFGRQNLVPHSHTRHSSGASLAAHSDSWLTPQDDLGINHQVNEWSFADLVGSSLDPSILTDDLSLGLNLIDPISRSPSPMPSPLSNTEPPSPELWDRRFEIHDEAFDALTQSLVALHDDLKPSYLRYILLPLLILSLLSRPESDERRLCFSYFSIFDEFMEKTCPRETPTTSTPTSNPIGGQSVKFDIPWERLDAFSEAAEREGRYYVLENERLLRSTAAEWNWWDMLKYTNLNLVWPVNAGTSHLERGSEFLAFQLISSIVNEECFSIWTQETVSSQSSSSCPYTYG